MKYGIEEQLHPDTKDLVDRFSIALAQKLLAAQIKYGYSNKWKLSDWQRVCQLQLVEHVAKGDPLDVAAYCAFMWHHGWSAASSAQVAVYETQLAVYETQLAIYQALVDDYAAKIKSIRALT